MYPECGKIVFRGRSPRNSIIPHEGYNPYTLENHSTADLYYDATTRHWGVFPCLNLSQSLYFTMQLGCIFIHPRMYEISRVHGFCTSCFFFEVWLHHSTNKISQTISSRDVSHSTNYSLFSPSNALKFVLPENLREHNAVCIQVADSSHC